MKPDPGIEASLAREVLNNPLFKAALDRIEQRAIDEARNVNGWMPGSDRKRRQLLDKANIVREIRSELQSVITTGKLAAKPQPGVA